MASTTIQSGKKIHGFHEVTDSELEAIAGGWYPALMYGAMLKLQAESQEEKVMDFLNSQLSPKA